MIAPGSKTASESAVSSYIDDSHGPLAGAMYALVHDFRHPRTGKRGAPALAPLVGMNPGTLANKVNPEQEHEPTLRETVQWQAITGDYRTLHAYAQVLGHAAYRLPTADEFGDVDLLARYTEFQIAIGAKACAIRQALADRHISRAEVDVIRAALQGVISTGLALAARFDALVERE